MKRKVRIVSYFMSILLFISLLPKSFVQASSDIKIISSTSISVEDAKAWAKQKGATDTFISLADLYWRYSSSHGNVNPAVAYIQSALETGFGKFGGVLDESYKNPCGMKTSTGGGDYDASAHQRFNTWDDGVTAHIDHLALYAGASGYPRQNTTDPRHFASICGKATTVQALTGNWATDSNYGNKIMNLYSELLELSVDVTEVLGVIDNPTNGQSIGNSLRVRGWALSNVGIEKVNIYIDNTLIKSTPLNVVREDVERAYPNYINARNSGFDVTLDISNISSGSKTLKVEMVAKNGVKNSATKNIVISRLSPLGCIDYPAENEKVTGNSLKVQGWALNGSGIKEVKIYIDGIYKASATTGLSRPDVNRVYPNYPNGETSGYSATIDLSGVTTGIETLTVEEIGNDGSSVKRNRKLSGNTKVFGSIDDPTSGKTVDNTLRVSGWALSNVGIEKVNIYIDNTLIRSTQLNAVREDVKKAYPDYTDARNSGFDVTLDISNISSGSKTLKVEMVAKNGVKNSATKNIVISRLSPLGCIDSPKENATVTSNSLKVQGWALNGSGIKEVKIYIDGIYKTSATIGLSRPDVNKVHPNYPNGTTSGYSATIDLSGVTTSIKTLTVEEIGNDGSSIKRNRNLAGTKVFGSIDNPTNGQTVSNTLRVRGWALSNVGIEKVNIYIDNTLIKSTPLNAVREDVKKAYPDYTDARNSGYDVTLDISNISNGSKTLKVEMVAKNGVKNSITKNIVISRLSPLGCIDYPAENATITGNTLKVQGWALNGSGIKEVKIYIDGVYKASVPVGLSRPDVDKVYPNYPNGTTSGYSTNIDLSYLSDGIKTLTVEEIGNDGSSVKRTKKFNYAMAKKMRIVVDAGHGGKDPGSSSFIAGVSYIEKDLNLAIALKTRAELEMRGYDVIMTRSSDVFLELKEISRRANDAKADLFISIHQNAFDSSSANGTEVYYTTNSPDSGFPAHASNKLSKSKELASLTVQNLVKALGTYNRGAKDGNLSVLRNTTMPAILVECGFLTNPLDALKLGNEDYQTKMAKAIADAVDGKAYTGN